MFSVRKRQEQAVNGLLLWNPFSAKLRQDPPMDPPLIPERISEVPLCSPDTSESPHTR